MMISSELFWLMVMSWICFGFLIGNWWGERGSK
jgi:hypothetical protein